MIEKNRRSLGPFLVLTLVVACSVSADEFNPFAGSQLLVAWADSWKKPTLQFAVYSNKRVIVRHDSGNSYGTMIVDEPTFKQLLSILESKRSWVDGQILGQRAGEHHSRVNSICVRRNGATRRVRVFGGSASATAAHQDKYSEIRAEIDGYIKLIRSWRKQVRSELTSWQPVYYELILVPYSYALKSVSWPEAWPGFDSPQCFLRTTESYSIFITADEFKEAKRAVPNRAAFVLNDSKWSVSIQPVFPHQYAWIPHQKKYLQGN